MYLRCTIARPTRWIAARRGTGSTIASSGTFSLACEVRSGSVCGAFGNGIADYDSAGLIPAGRVGVWAGAGSAAVKFDDVVLRSLAANLTVDGRFTDDTGNVRVSGGKLEFWNSDGTTRRAVLKHVRMSKGVTQVDLTYNNSFEQGVILHYQDSENFGVALLAQAGLGTSAVYYVEFVDGKK
ncbi:MAG: hypothetical protein JNG88_18020, partial [Phycisphaerales bacterium]|nr:hypothetical protein [Phycisphaerales bacterium]